jgi:hypothetical protein
VRDLRFETTMRSEEKEECVTTKKTPLFFLVKVFKKMYSMFTSSSPSKNKITPKGELEETKEKEEEEEHIFTPEHRERKKPPKGTRVPLGNHQAHSSIIPAHYMEEKRIRHSTKKKLRHTHSAVTFDEASSMVNRISIQQRKISKRRKLCSWINSYKRNHQAPDGF